MAHKNACPSASVRELLVEWMVNSELSLANDKVLAQFTSVIKERVFTKVKAEVLFSQNAGMLADAMEIDDGKVIALLRRKFQEKRDAAIGKIVLLVEDDRDLDAWLHDALRGYADERQVDELVAVMFALGKAGKGRLIDPLLDAFSPEDDSMRHFLDVRAYEATKDAWRLPRLRHQAERFMARETGFPLALREDHFLDLWQATQDPQDLERSRQAAHHKGKRDAQARAWLRIAQATGLPQDLLKAFDHVFKAEDDLENFDQILARCVEKFLYMAASAFMDFGEMTEKEPWSDDVRRRFLHDLAVTRPDAATSLEEAYDEVVRAFKK